MKKILPFLLLSVCLQPAKTQTFNANLANKLQTTLDSLFNLFSTNTIGISAGVYCPGQGLWKGVSGTSYAGQPITSDMAFGIASNTKLFTAVTLLKLAESNVLSLDDAISAWIPNYTNVNPNITIRQLLNHTSGVSDPFFTTGLLDSIQAHPSHVYTPQEVLSWLGPPNYPPGGGYSYSNINYILAGMVAESAAGVSIAQLIRTNLLNPLQLNSVFFDIAEPVTGTLAHRWHAGVDIHDVSRISLNTSGGPAGALFSTAGDIALWYNALMSNQVLNAASFAQMTTFLSPGNYGLGIQKTTFYNRTTWGHAGSTLGYTSRTIYDPCMKTTVCCISNSDLSAVDGITVLLYQVLINNLPSCAGTITGATTVCQGQNSVSYTVPAITNAVSYAWTLPNGASGTSATNSITVNYSVAAVSGNVTVKGINTYGEGAPASLPIIVHNKPVTPVITSNGNMLHSNAAAGNQWYNQTGPIINATGQDYTIPANGNYYTIVSLLGCSSDPSNVINAVLAPLGVTWLDFTGEICPDGNLLQWSTASEIDNRSFEIERSADGLTFETAGSVASAGNSTTVQHYLFRDKKRPAALLYYRLKQVGMGGKIDYSETIALENKAASPIYLYPNPVQSNLYVNGLSGEDTRFQIIDPLGRMVLEGSIALYQPVAMGSLRPGLYFIKIASGSLKFKKE